MIGTYYAKNPERASKKILRQIFFKTGIENPIFKMYNENTKILYKYAGQVEEANKTNKAEIKFLKKNKIQAKYKYITQQIEYKKY